MEQKQVYLVWDSDGYHRRLIGVFSTMEKAQRFVLMERRDKKVQAIPLDELEGVTPIWEALVTFTSKDDGWYAISTASPTLIPYPRTNEVGTWVKQTDDGYGRKVDGSAVVTIRALDMESCIKVQQDVLVQFYEWIQTLGISQTSKEALRTYAENNLPKPIDK